MANMCSFSMQVNGKHEDIEKFYNAMIQKGNPYMGRGAEADIEYEDGYDGDGIDRAFINGWCKWSIQSALIDNAISMRTNPDMWYWGDGVDKSKLEFITLLEATKKWNLVIEVYSEEPGCEFQEHYVFDNGTVLCDECVEYIELYLGDYDTKEEVEDEYGIIITDEEWENKDYISRGGFENWDFDI